ncbi:MAG TPA: sigma factor [Streptosporangiaceae bacterium]
MSSQQTEFADFFQASWEPCLRAVVAVVGSPQLAEDQVAEAFAKAWVSWRKVRRHPVPRAWVVRTALSFGYFQLPSGEQQADSVLIDSSSYTCTSTPPDPNGPPDGYGQSDSVGLLYGGPGPGGS